MNQRDGFASGFIAGTIFGSLVGGVIGTLLAAKTANNEIAADDVDVRRHPISSANIASRARRRQIKPSTEQSIEVARRSLEDKIAQLNETIDEVRLTLGQVNGNAMETNSDRSSVSDP